MIYSFEINGKECNATNSWFAKFFGMNKKYASEVLNSLSRKNRIGIQLYRDRVSRNIRKRVCRIIGIPIQKKPEGTYKGHNKESYIKSYIKDEKFFPVITDWLNYKKDKNQNYKSDQSIKKMIDKLSEYSEGNPETAREIIDLSIQNNWDGFFKQKDKNGKQKDTKPASTAELIKDTV